jgi:hypothetical protein
MFFVTFDYACMDEVSALPVAGKRSEIRSWGWNSGALFCLVEMRRVRIACPRQRLQPSQTINIFYQH